MKLVLPAPHAPLPVTRATAKVHNGNDDNSLGLDRIENTEGESRDNPPPNVLGKPELG